MTTDEIRQSFIEFFKSKGHSAVASSSLVPAGDPTLLFTNAGMVQFKDCFLGADKRDYVRATTCQKCLRISGKHNDLENVGRTARHHTFFEMLGNFSFGDYFKEDAIKYAWEFITETLALDKNRLWVTIYKEDDDAEKLWQQHTDVVKERILRYGEKDNFWAMGDTGPCGPCSEIFYYLGDDVANQSEEEFRKDDGTYMEIWNLVFMQFNRDINGNLEPLPKPSVDTGMGLERVASVKQGVLANYDGDLFRKLISKTEKLSGKNYIGEDYSERSIESDSQYATDVAMRVIADHSRASAFLVADGVNPSSDGRGYVLRRLIRRACRHGRSLGFTKAFLFQVADEVVSIYGKIYPELKESKDIIKKLIKAEEEKFLVTLDTGLSVLQKEVDALSESNDKSISGEVAFQLHDTYGFPLDLTEDIVKNKGLVVDSEGFHKFMEAQRERSRSARSETTELILQRSVKPIPTQFVGYDYDEYESSIKGIYNAEGELKAATSGDEVAVVVSETPFYGESGGQIGDAGGISGANGTLEVIDTQKVGGDTIVHICRVAEGDIKVDDKVRLEIEIPRRKKLRVNHSATHLLHLALREVLGDHVKQAGSRVSDQTLRFDFSHFEPITAEQLEEIELIINQQVQANHLVETDILPIEEAKKTGAMALFGEKYGDLVRVVQIGSRSRELCGGTHVERSGDIGIVSLIAEGGVSAGVRRVEATAGIGALEYLRKQKRILGGLSGLLRTSDVELNEKVERLIAKGKDLEREVERLGSSVNSQKGGDLSNKAEVLASGTKIIAGRLEEVTPKQLREMADDLKSRLGSGCIALASISEGKAIMLTAVTDDLTKKYHAGNLIREMSKLVGGKGGGRADLAQAGGGDPEKIDTGLERFRELIS